MSGSQLSWLDNHPDFISETRESILYDGIKLAAGETDWKPDPNLVKTLRIPPKIQNIFKGKYRYRGAYGGRGSGKSHNFALKAAERGYLKKEKILCAREIQRTIQQSVMSQIVEAIEEYPFLKAFYEIGKSYIRGKNGTEFIFLGLRHNPQEIKSTHGVTICWVEEAEGVSSYSWKILKPTIREKDSEIWLTWNPESADSATHEQFIKNPPKSSRIRKVNYTDNPYFPDVLDQERLEDLENQSYEYYEHVWLGEIITISEAQIFADKWEVQEFEPKHNWDGPYQGLDFGFSNDPTAATRSWIFDNCLYIEYSPGQTRIELDDISDYFCKRIPNFEEYITRADNARPDSISHLKSKGLPRIIPCEKPRLNKGSILDGIEHIKKYHKIIIHPRCENMIKEARLYSYKIDRQSEEVLPIVVDAYNHWWDSVRYSLEPIMKNKFRDYSKIV